MCRQYLLQIWVAVTADNSFRVIHHTVYRQGSWRLHQEEYDTRSAGGVTLFVLLLAAVIGQLFASAGLCHLDKTVNETVFMCENDCFIVTLVEELS